MLAGLLDAGFASLGTFLTGIYAVRELDPTTLGGYALAYMALFSVGILPAYLIFTPAEVAVVTYPVERRLDHLRRSVSLGAPVALVAALSSALWMVAAPAEVQGGAARALTVTAVVAAFLSPIQDHVRHMLHAGGRSWQAAVVSMVQFGSVLVALGALVAAGVPAAWVPFGALGFANLVSLGYGLLAGQGSMPVPAAERLRLRELVDSGRWVLGGAIINPIAGFAAAAIVSHLAGAEALGYAEGSRVVAQPVWVLAVGLSFVLGPRSMEAGRQRDRERGRAISRKFVALVALAGLGCAALLGGPWPWNPLRWLVPVAYTVAGLTLLTIIAQTVNGLYFAQRSELLGARREASLTKAEVAAGAARMAVATTAGVLHAYAVPLAFLAVGVVRGITYRWLFGRLYAPSAGAAREHAETP